MFSMFTKILWGFMIQFDTWLGSTNQREPREFSFINPIRIGEFPSFKLGGVAMIPGMLAYVLVWFP